ncbi:MAG: M56 family metallopeptidase [Planctomycetaceae bacterium]
MIDHLAGFMPLLLRASVFLALTSLLARLFCTGKRYPRLQRAVWCAVLLQGLILVRFELPTQWLPGDAQDALEELQLPQADLESDLQTILAGSDQIVGPAATAPTSGATSTAGWMQLAVWVWIGGAFLAFCCQLIAYVRFLQAVEYTDTPEEWQRDWAEVCGETQLRTETPIFATTNAGPLVCWLPSGYRLLVPSAHWRQLTKSQRATVMCHEVAHIQRGDMWKSVVVRLLALPHWFNPFAWLAVRRFEDCAEWACDDATHAAMPDEMSDYARALLELGRTTSKTPSPVSAANGRPLVERIQRVLNPIGKDTRLMKTKALIATSIVALLTGVNSVRLVQAGQQKQESEPTKEAVVVGSKKTEQQNATTTVVGSKNLKVSNGELAKVPLTSMDHPKQPDVVGRLNAPSDDEAVVDINRLFKEHPRFQRLRKELMSKINMARLATNKVRVEAAGNPAVSLGEHRLAMQKSLMEEESRIYLEVFRDIQSEIGRYARENGIRVVGRASTQPIQEGHEKLTPQEVIQLMNRPVIFIDDQPRDITEAIRKRIKKKEEKAAAREPVDGIPVLSQLPVVGPVFSRSPARR